MQARNSKKPTSSKNIDIAVTEIKSVKIFNGLTAPPPVMPCQQSAKVMGVNTTAHIAPTSAIIGFRGRVNLFIFISGLISTHATSETQHKTAITIVEIISGIISSYSF